MKPFDLNEAIAGKRIITKSHLKAVFVGYDETEEDFPVVAKIYHAPGFATDYFFTKDGRYSIFDNFTNFDLMMADERDKEIDFEKKKGDEK